MQSTTASTNVQLWSELSTRTHKVLPVSTHICLHSLVLQMGKLDPKLLMEMSTRRSQHSLQPACAFHSRRIPTDPSTAQLPDLTAMLQYTAYMFAAFSKLYPSFCQYLAGCLGEDEDTSLYLFLYLLQITVLKELTHFTAPLWDWSHCCIVTLKR